MSDGNVVPDGDHRGVPIITEPGVRHRHHMRHRLEFGSQPGRFGLGQRPITRMHNHPRKRIPHPGLMLPEQLDAPLRRHPGDIPVLLGITTKRHRHAQQHDEHTNTSEQRPNRMPGTDMPQPIQQ